MVGYARLGLRGTEWTQNMYIFPWFVLRGNNSQYGVRFRRSTLRIAIERRSRRFVRYVQDVEAFHAYTELKSQRLHINPPVRLLSSYVISPQHP